MAEKLTKIKKQAAEAQNYITRHNIYKKGVFEKLIELANEIEKISKETKAGFQQVIVDAGIEDPFETLIKGMNYWDKKLGAHELPSELELINRLQNEFQLRVKKASISYVPTDELEYSGEGGHEKSKEGEDQNRVALAIETILHMEVSDRKIQLNDLSITISEPPEHTWRTRPYWLIEIKSENIAVLLNNQFANRTFVFHYKTKNDLEKQALQTKEELKQKAEQGAAVHHFIYENPEQFKEALATAIHNCAMQIEMIKPYETVEEAIAAIKKLGIRTTKEYFARSAEDPRLLSRPDAYYKVSFLELLGKKKQYYKTCHEAKAAAKRLGINSSSEYRKHRRKDPKLPPSPHKIYPDFSSWYVFLDKEKPKCYETLEEAKAALKKLKITTRDEYLSRYREDPLLPGRPDVYYQDFSGWYDFVDKEEPEYYETLEEAEAAVNKLRITTKDEYYRRYREDPRLPGRPDVYYRGFLNWPVFFGREKPKYYETLEEAKAATKKLKIKTWKEYVKRYKEDPLLPSNPNRIFKNEWKSWLDFLGKK
jgi:hypothetical protein